MTFKFVWYHSMGDSGPRATWGNDLSFSCRTDWTRVPNSGVVWSC